MRWSPKLRDERLRWTVCRLQSVPKMHLTFLGCECTITNTTCGTHQSCEMNGCDGQSTGLAPYAQCTTNILGCKCTAQPKTCGDHKSCDMNGCGGEFNGLAPDAQCTNNFVGCYCTAQPDTCGDHKSCELNNCAGASTEIQQFAQCTDNFIGCNCTAIVPTTCGTEQTCDLNGCAGEFDLTNARHSVPAIFKSVLACIQLTLVDRRHRFASRTIVLAPLRAIHPTHNVRTASRAANA